MAKNLNDLARETQTKRYFVLISCGSPPSYNYYSIIPKQKAEKYLLEQCPHLTVTILKPGYIVSWVAKPWSVLFAQPYYVMNFLWRNLWSKLPGFSAFVQDAMPERPTRLAIIAEIVESAAIGNTDTVVFEANDFRVWESISPQLSIGRYA